jgi:2-keto-4-pentenoate hydratase/2-oxohepta-3-ene-1,7-dioic acid hydratase in catechol pathway
MNQVFNIFYRHITLEPGDLLLTGTPAGVSTVKAGDQIRCVMSNEGNDNTIMELQVGVEHAKE